MNIRLIPILLALFTAATLRAQVPQLLNYQGRVAVGAVNFDGSGQFKFALVNTNGTTTYWSNDSTSAAGSQPTAAVSLTVTKGLYSVLLGDIALTNMTAIPASVWANADVRLRVWFNDGTNGSQLLAPDQRIAAVGYAMVAGNAASVADGAITSAKIAAGAVGGAQLGAGAALANLNASGQSTVGSGGVILSEQANAQDLISAGYVKIGTATLEAERWENRSGAAPTPRRLAASVWTGSELIVWGGVDGSLVSTGTGGRYDPATNRWRALVPAGNLSPRSGPTAVWTGTEMIVWGGETLVPSFTRFNNGARYDPATDTWRPVSAAGAPEARRFHTAVWTGSEMIVWGGDTVNSANGNTGGRYSPVTDTWAPTSLSGAAAARDSHVAV